MCGIIGIVGQSEVAGALYDGLTVLQHRGQDAAGIATVDGSRVCLHKGNGLVADVFEPADMLRLGGRVGIGHCRYPTAGSAGSERWGSRVCCRPLAGLFAADPSSPAGAEMPSA